MPKRANSPQHFALIGAVDLVDEQHRRLAAAAQRGEDVLVLRQDAVARINHEDEQVGFLDRGQRLLRGEAGEAFVFARQAAGVDQHEGPVFDQAAHPVMGGRA